MRYLALILFLFVSAIQSNPLLQKPATLSALDVEKRAHEWQTIFNWDFGKGRNFICFYENGDASFLLQLFGVPLRSHKFQYISALKKYLTSPAYQQDYYLEKPLKYDKPCPQAMNINELYKFLANKKFIFYTGAGISAGTVATMAGLEKALRIKEGKAIFVKEIFFHPSTITKAFKEFCHTAICSQPTGAHQAVATIAALKQVAIVTENVDLLQQRTGVNPIFAHSDAIHAVTQKDLEEIDTVVCIGLSHDDRGFLARYKKDNTRGQIAAIDIGMPNYLAAEDFLIREDIQTALPTLAKKFSAEGA